MYFIIHLKQKRAFECLIHIKNHNYNILFSDEQRKKEKELREQKLLEEKMEKQREKELKEQQRKIEREEKGMHTVQNVVFHFREKKINMYSL